VKQELWHGYSTHGLYQLYEAGFVHNHHYIAMALIEGCNLTDCLAPGVLKPNRVAQITADLAEALGYAHERGIMHRGVQPANVRLDQRGNVYLVDFGIAYLLESGVTPYPPEQTAGTLAYMAPVQVQGSGIVPPASDHYSLESVFYHMLCGQPPFLGTPSYVALHTVHDIPTLPPQCCSEHTVLFSRDLSQSIS
jgi:eukaryotic-like serine/threonine-protein kinase